MYLVSWKKKKLQRSYALEVELPLKNDLLLAYVNRHARRKCSSILEKEFVNLGVNSLLYSYSCNKLIKTVC
jgi:hypothetical protein